MLSSLIRRLVRALLWFAAGSIVVVLALRGVANLGNDHVDGRPDEREKEQWRP